MLDF